MSGSAQPNVQPELFGSGKMPNSRTMSEGCTWPLFLVLLLYIRKPTIDMLCSIQMPNSCRLHNRAYRCPTGYPVVQPHQYNRAYRCPTGYPVVQPHQYNHVYRCPTGYPVMQPHQYNHAYRCPTGYPVVQPHQYNRAYRCPTGYPVVQPHQYRVPMVKP